MNRMVQNGDSLVIDYDLIGLPTAQHKAGLAGLLVMIGTMEARAIAPLPSVEHLTPTSARITFTRDSLQKVFDDLYDAQWVEIESKSRRDKTVPKRIIEKVVDANGRTEKRFIYDAVQPKGMFLQLLFDGEGSPWVTLWRNMLWKTLRAKHLSRAVYQARADGKPYPVESLWNGLIRACKQQQKGRIQTENFSSSIFIGAEDSNSEKVPFKGTVDNNLLLHFWPVVSLIFVPRTASPQSTRESGWKGEKDEGYILAIPEPSALRGFIIDVQNFLKGLDLSTAGLYPKDCLIDLVPEAGMEYLYHFSRNRIVDSDLNLSLCAVELYHLQKKGNRIRHLAAERMAPRREVLLVYEPMRQRVRNPFFKSIYLRNILEDRRWHEQAEGVLHRYPMPVFVHNREKSPKDFFGRDVRSMFSVVEQALQFQKEEMKMEATKLSEEACDNQLALRIYRLIQTYVNHRTEEKSGKKYKDFSANRDEKNRVIYPDEYREAREKVCSDAFLAMRGRREQDFVEYFSGTICSVPQYLPETEFVAVAEALHSDWERAKTLSMLALSAHSYLV